MTYYRIPLEVAEVYCLSCNHRYVTIVSETTWLKDMQCTICNTTGHLIMTGQKIMDTDRPEVRDAVKEISARKQPKDLRKLRIPPWIKDNNNENQDIICDSMAEQPRQEV